MSPRISLLSLLLILAIAPASGQVLYENGPLNGTVDAWTINFGYVVSDTFTLVNASTVKGFDLAVWEFPGDRALTVDWMISSREFGGNVYGTGTAGVTDRFISVNQYGYDIDEITATGLNVPLSSGTYWLNMGNAVTEQGNPLYWDENNGVGCHSVGCPSQPSENGVGTILSESFDVLGVSESGGQTPEPGEIILFGSGVLALAGRLWRKLS